MKIILATNNKNKAREIKEILNFNNCEILTLAEAGITSDPEETGVTFEENAEIKARAVLDALQAGAGFGAQQVGEGNAREALQAGAGEDGQDIWVLADDSGLYVDALGGAPGVFSSRFAGEHGNDAANNEKLLQELTARDALQEEARNAYFACVIVMLNTQGKKLVAEGKVDGIIGFEERGENGFGYDPLFYPDAFEHTRSFAEASAEEKNSLSHRGNALRKLREMLAK